MHGERVVFPSTFANYGAQPTREVPLRVITDLGENRIEERVSWI